MASLRRCRPGMCDGQLALIEAFTTACLADVKAFLLKYAPNTTGDLASVAKTKDFKAFKATALHEIQVFLCQTVLLREPTPSSFEALDDMMIKRVNLDSRWSIMLSKFLQEAGAWKSSTTASQAGAELEISSLARPATPRRIVTRAETSRGCSGRGGCTAGGSASRAAAFHRRGARSSHRPR